MNDAGKQGNSTPRAVPRLLREAIPDASSSAGGEMRGEALPIGIPPRDPHPSVHTVGAPQPKTPGVRVERGRGDSERTLMNEKLETPVADLAETLKRDNAALSPLQDKPAMVTAFPALAQTAGANPLAPAPLESQPGLERPSVAEMPAEDLPYSASGRLGVLRKLFFAPAFPSAPAHDASEYRTEREAGHSEYAGASDVSVRDESESATLNPISVTAQPEILKPKITPASTFKEKEPLRAVPTPPRRDSADDIETLPSWRGQYRKRRFPST